MGKRWSAGTVAAVLFVLCVSGSVRGEDLPPEEGRYTGPCMGEEAFREGWLDRAHFQLTRIFCQPSVWFDDFFGEHRAGEDWPGSLVRWESAVRFDEGEDEPILRSEFDASFRLPKMSRKLSLVFTSETRDDVRESRADDDPYDLEPPPQSGAPGNKRTTAGLRYFLSDSKRARLNIDTGFKIKDPFQPYLRLRLRYTHPVGSSSLVRLIPSVIWLREDGINRSFRLDVEKRISENVLIRASQSFVRREEERATFWGTVLSLFDRLSERTVLAIETAASGVTYPESRVERYRLGVRLRSNFLRRWLFLEVEPELYWPRDDEGRYPKHHAITLRTELQFFS